MFEVKTLRYAAGDTLKSHYSAFLTGTHARVRTRSSVKPRLKANAASYRTDSRRFFSNSKTPAQPAS